MFLINFGSKVFHLYVIKQVRPALSYWSMHIYIYTHTHIYIKFVEVPLLNTSPVLFYCLALSIDSLETFVFNVCESRRRKIKLRSCWPFTDSYWTTIAGLARVFSGFLWPSRGHWVMLDGMIKQWDSGLLNQFLEAEDSFGRSFEIKNWAFT